jgi:putative transcriptional regulator
VGDSLRGQLLIAAPALQDYFRRSVVLVLEHNEEGAMGLVLNRPTETTVAEALPELSDLADLADDGLVHAGGPVQPQAVLILGDFDDPAQAGTPVVHNLGLLDPEQPEPELRRARVFAGYAGWAPGQLDAELDEEAWITAEATPDDPFLDGDLWPEVLQRKGGGFALLSTMPEDPSLN